jgi:hypothetical protein
MGALDDAAAGVGCAEALASTVSARMTAKSRLRFDILSPLLKNQKSAVTYSCSTVALYEYKLPVRTSVKSL